MADTNNTSNNRFARPTVAKAYVAPMFRRDGPAAAAASSTTPASVAATRRPSDAMKPRTNNATPSTKTPVVLDEPAVFPAKTIELLDPLCKGGKISVPVERTMPTKGRADWAKLLGTPGERDVSLCCLHHDGKCRAGNACRQIHVDRAYVEYMRAAQKNVVSCCLGCNDTASQTQTAQSAFFELYEKVRGVQLTGSATYGMPGIAIDQLGFTRGLEDIVADTVRAMPAVKPEDQPHLQVSWSNVCRLHLKGACKYGKDCKHVHICTEVGPELLAIAADNASNAYRTPSPVDEVEPAVVASAPASRCSCCSTEPATPEPIADAAVVKRTEPETVAKPLGFAQPPAPLALRASFPMLDEGSLKLRDEDLDELVFDVPTLASAPSTTFATSAMGEEPTPCVLPRQQLSDFFGLPSPAASPSPLMTRRSAAAVSPDAFMRSRRQCLGLVL